MADVKISSKHQIVIPREAREALQVKRGARLEVVVRGDMVVLLRKPRKYSRAIAGIGKGLYGEAYLSRERESWR
jgi:AbrB family looped-hinge helix DNA binding protein